MRPFDASAPCTHLARASPCAARSAPWTRRGRSCACLALPCSKEEYYARSSVKMSEGYARVAALPGAKRLLAHLLGGRASAGAGGAGGAAGGAETAAAGENGRAPAG